MNIKLTFILRPKREITKSRITREEYKLHHSAMNDDVEIIKEFATKNNLTITDINLIHKTVKILVPSEKFPELFGTHIIFEGKYFKKKNIHNIPNELQGIVKHIIGFSNKPIMKTHMSPVTPSATPFVPQQVAEIYNFPANTGAPVTVGIVEYGGGFSADQFVDYWPAIGLTTTQNIISVSVDGALNLPGDGGDTDEVGLDVSIIGAILPPNSTIVVYFAPNDDSALIDMTNAIIHDSINNPIVISNSWGQVGIDETLAAANDEIYATGVALGISFFVASGDSGVDSSGSYPATCPYVTATGATTLIVNPDNSIYSEYVWNDGEGDASGGGIDESHEAPTYQEDISILTIDVLGTEETLRGTPDVAANGDPATGYYIALPNINIKPFILSFGGTSAVAPLYTGLIGVISSLLGGRSFGQLNPIFYENPTLFNDITFGNNTVPDTGGYDALTGWDFCTGLGSPKGTAIYNKLWKSLEITPEQPLVFDGIQLIDTLFLNTSINHPITDNVLLNQKVTFRLLPQQYITDDLVLVDSTNLNFQFPIDPLNLTDAVTFVNLAQQNVSDILTLTQSGRLYKTNYSVSDILNLTQAVHSNIIDCKIIDNISLNDKVFTTVPYTINLTDSIVFYDVSLYLYIPSPVKNISVIDILTVTNKATTINKLNISLQDSFSLSPSLSRIDSPNCMGG